MVFQRDAKIEMFEQPGVQVTLPHFIFSGVLDLWFNPAVSDYRIFSLSTRLGWLSDHSF